MTDDTPLFIAHDVPDLINSLPALFGFMPRESLVAIAVSGPRRRFGFRLRVDLPPPEHREVLADSIAGHLDRHCEEDVFLIAVSSDPDNAAATTRAVRDHLTSARVDLLVWATDDRWWSDDPHCPDEGEPYERDPYHPAVVAAVAAGMPVLGSRDEIDEEFAPVTGPLRAWIDSAYPQIIDRLACRRDLLEDFAVVEGVLDRVVGGEVSDPSDGEILDVLARLPDLRVRDRAWSYTSRATARELLRFWTRAATIAHRSVVHVPLTLAAFNGWQSGDGTRALCAAERAVAAAPDYTLARLTLQILEAGIDPRQWDCAGESMREDVTAFTAHPSR